MLAHPMSNKHPARRFEYQNLEVSHIYFVTIDHVTTFLKLKSFWQPLTYGTSNDGEIFPNITPNLFRGAVFLLKYCNVIGHNILILMYQYDFLTCIIISIIILFLCCSTCNIMEYNYLCVKKNNCAYVII